MKNISREYIKRMIDGGTGGSGGGGGIDMSALAGLASQSWVDGSYVSKAFWNELFEIKTKVETIVKDSGGGIISDTTIDGPDLAPNTLPSETSSTDETTGNVTTVKTTIDSIKAKKGLWTDFFLSALGKNASGTGGVLSLNDLVDVEISNPQSGEVLKYNGTKWVNGTGGGGGSTAWDDITGKPTTLSGYGITDAKIVSGTIYLGSSSITPITTETDPTVPAWAKASTKPSYSFSELTSHPTTLSGYGITDAYTKSEVYTKTEADSKFMTIAAFENLFNALNSSGQKVNHPYSSAVASIKALFGLWTDQYLSALGNNSSGGGTILAEPLASINTASLGMPTASGQVITWNGTQWIYSIPGGGGGGTGTVTSITAGTGLSGGTITTMGTIAINSTYQGYISEGHTAYGWGNHANAGYLTGINATMINNALGFTLSGTSGTTYNLATIASNASHGETAYDLRHSHTNKSVLDGITSAKVSSWDLVAGASWWGRTLSSNGTVTGSIDAGSGGGSITGFHSFELNGYGTLSGYGGFIDFHYNGSSADYTSRIIEDASGQLSLIAQNGVRIGDALLIWDSKNYALKITRKVNGYDVACNLYATGGVSALGLSTGGSVTNLTVSNTLTIGNKILLNDSDGGGKIISNGDRIIISTDNSSWIYLDDMCSLDGPNTWKIYTYDGYAYFNRYYLDQSHYLFVDNGTLYYYNGSTTPKQVAFTN